MMPISIALMLAGVLQVIAASKGKSLAEYVKEVFDRGSGSRSGGNW